MSTVDESLRIGVLAKLEHHLGTLRQQRQAKRIVFLEQRGCAPEQVLGRVHVAARERATRRPRRVARARIASDLVARLVDRAELAEIPVRLLQVIAEDLFELLAAIAFGVDLVGPADELDVHGRARALEQAVVDGVAHQVMVEAIDRIGVRRGNDGWMNCLRVSAFNLPWIAGSRDLGRERLDRGCRKLHADYRCRSRSRPFSRS